ncbi:hypothetical protein SAMN04487820_1093 [Actinopolyspora mzabensis]|uniref:Uncharacterized protein n=1 Tax=Actinopolyspora mzabensis TaxID=995066 RepID=A0A1G9CN16_ACTMZ|nr:hypothetical protein [Actinopolyspora mzabensis]SDK52979.1 hypothetical protein SAMN04487820_1093 [Actinopolyspora mzabensis]
MSQERSAVGGRGAAGAGRFRLATETAGTIVVVAAPVLLVVSMAGFYLAAGVATGWDYEATEASWILLGGFGFYVWAIMLLGAPLSFLLCGVTRRTSLPERIAVRRAVLFAAAAGLLVPELMLLAAGFM